MNNNHAVKLHKATSDDLYKISLESTEAKSGEIFIFENADMAELFDKSKAEKLRESFLKNNIKVKQITNAPDFPKFTDNDEFVNKVMTFRYVPKHVFHIHHEILIFDDTVAIYNKSELLVIKDEAFAKSQKQLFMSIWEQGQSPKLGFDYTPNHSFYNSIDYFMGDLQIIVWPDADAINAYNAYSEEQLGEYIKGIISEDKYFEDATYIIAFIWAMDKEKMIDIWKFNENYVDDRSGPLSDVRVYKEGKLCNELGLASGNTLMVLGYEERLRRQSTDLKSYLDGPIPTLPLEIMNGKDFFK